MEFSKDHTGRRWGPAVVLCALLGGATSLEADAPGRLKGRPENATSIHALELRVWKTREQAGFAPQHAGDRVSIVAPRPRLQSTTHEVHGYHPYWMGTSYTSYDWSLLTTVAFFALELDGTGAVTNDHGWPWTDLVSQAHANGVRCLVTAALFSPSALDAFLASPANRQTALGNLVDAVLVGGADGVHLDFEGVPGNRKQDLVTFVGELRDTLQASLVDPYLSVATPAVDWSNAYDYDELASRCQHLVILAYDYHWSGSATTGPVAPLAGWDPYNVSWTVQDYQTWGAPVGKMILSVPYYGYRWGAVSGAPEAQTTSSGTARTYEQTVSETTLYGPLWDEESQTPWYRYQDPGWLQVWHENELSLAAKYDLVRSEGLAGIGIWALGYDGAQPELWQALQDAFGESVDANEVALATLSAGPNPFRDVVRFRIELEAAVPARMILYDVGGHRVREVLHGWVPEGRVYEVAWDGRDDRGRAVAAGVYVARLQSAGSSRSLRIVRIR